MTEQEIIDAILDAETPEDARRCRDMIERFGLTDMIALAAESLYMIDPPEGAFEEAAWDPAAHPRAPAGSPTGGQFIPADSSEQGQDSAVGTSFPDERPANAKVQRYANQIAALLKKRGLPVEQNVPIVVSNQLPEGTLAVSLPGRIVLRGDISKAVFLSVRDEKIGLGVRPEVQVLVHEFLHRIQGVAEYTSSFEGDPEWAAGHMAEEGVVEAVAHDVMPSIRRARLGFATSDDAGLYYKDQVVEVRRLSARATGKPWTSYQARVWRRNLLLADFATRTAMMEEARAR